MMRVKNHQMPPTIRVDRALGMSSDPGVKEAARMKVKQQDAFISTSHYHSNLLITFIFNMQKPERTNAFRNGLVSRTHQVLSAGRYATRIKIKSLERALKTSRLLDLKQVKLSRLSHKGVL